MAVTTPTAFWVLGESSGDRLDSVGSIDLTPNNSPAQRFAHKGYGCHFTAASSQWLEHADNATLSGGNFCFMAVVNADSFGATRTILSKSDGATWEYTLYYSIGSNRFSAYFENGGSSAIIVANNLGAPSTGTRYLIFFWHDSVNNEVGIQVNNGTPDTASYSGGVADTAHPFRVGSDAGIAYWDGTIEQVALWKGYIPNSTERAELWNGGVLLRLAEFPAGAASPITIYAHNGSGAQGYEAWPALTALSNPTLYCVLSDATDHTADDTVVKGFTSTNSGATWGSMVTVASEGGVRCAVNHGSIFNDTATGSLLCSFARSTGGSFLDMKIRRSTDSGTTWGAWATVSPPSGYDFIFPYGQMTRISGDLYRPAYGVVTATGYGESFLMKSTDNGQTWVLHGVIAAGDATHYYSETDAINVSGNNWIAFVRDENSGGRIFKTTSSDGASTWSAPSVFDTGVGGTPPALYKQSSSIIHLFYGPRAGAIIAPKHWASPDGGTTFYGPSYWSNPLSGGITMSDWAYPSPMGANGELKFAYYAPGSSGTDVLFDTTGLEVPLLFSTGTCPGYIAPFGWR